MAATYNIKGTSTSQFQIGKTGQKIVNSGNDLHLETSSGTVVIDPQSPSTSPSLDIKSSSKKISFLTSTSDIAFTSLDGSVSYGNITSSSTGITIDILNASALSINGYSVPNPASADIGQVLQKGSSVLEWATPSGGSGSIGISQEGTSVSSSVSNINFTGSGVAVTSGSGGTVNVAIAGPTTSLIQQITSTSETGTVTFSSIPGTFDDLYLVVEGNVSGGATDILMSVNSDTSSIYSAATWNRYGADQSRAIYPARITVMEGSTAYSSNLASLTTIQIPSYAVSGIGKRASANQQYADTTSTFSTVYEWNWDGTAAITHLELWPASGTFSVGTVFKLYGRPAAGSSTTGGSSTLSGLTDVNLTTSPTDGQALIWDNATSKWIAGSVSSGSFLALSGGTMTGNIAMGTHSITGLSDPSSAQDAATKHYVDNISTTLTGDVTGSGSGSFATTLANSGVTAGTYTKLTVNAKGLITAGTNLTTLSGYGITDAINSSSATTTATANKLLYLNGSAQLPADITGNSATATKLATSRTISLTGDGTASMSFDGSGNATSALTLANSGVTAGTYSSVTVNAKGLVTAGTNPAVAASSLSGTTLASGVITSSLTSVGTLGSLSVTGGVTAGSFTGDGSALTNVAVQTITNGTSSITIPSSGGNINFNVASTAGVVSISATGATVTGNWTTTGNIVSGSGTGGTISGANLVSANYLQGTINTAAQPNITSVGTLTGLAVAGTITTTVGYNIPSVTTGIVAAGASQGTATALSTQVNIVSSTPSSTGVILPTPTIGMRITVANTDANALLVYPPSGSAINALSTNNGYSVAAGTAVDFIAISSTLWYTK